MENLLSGIIALFATVCTALGVGGGSPATTITTPTPEVAAVEYFEAAHMEESSPVGTIEQEMQQWLQSGQYVADKGGEEAQGVMQFLRDTVRQAPLDPKEKVRTPREFAERYGQPLKPLGLAIARDHRVMKPCARYHAKSHTISLTPSSLTPANAAGFQGLSLLVEGYMARESFQTGAPPNRMAAVEFGKRVFHQLDPVLAEEALWLLQVHFLNEVQVKDGKISDPPFWPNYDGRLDTVFGASMFPDEVKERAEFMRTLAIFQVYDERLGQVAAQREKRALVRKIYGSS